MDLKLNHSVFDSENAMMSSVSRLYVKWLMVAAALAVVAAFGVSARAQEAANTSAQGGSYVDDWSHHHLVYSNPGAREDAVKHGTLDQWQKIANDPRYQLQLSKRSAGARSVVADPNLATADPNLATETFDAAGGLAARHGFPLRPRPFLGNPIKKDWSTPLGSGTAGTPLTITITSPGTGTVGSTSTFTVDGATFTASAPGAASGRGTFTGNPATGTTVTIGGSLVLTASDSTAATATVTVGASTCFQTGSGINLGGTTITTTAAPGTGTYTVSGAGPTNGETVVIGGVTYHFEATLTGAPANSVLIGTNITNTARNLSVAIAGGTGTCGNGSPCTNATTANPLVSSTNLANVTQTMTALCANNASITNTSGTNVAVGTVATGTLGTQSTALREFALGTVAGTTSNTTIASNINTIINGSASFDTVFTSTAPSNVVDISAIVWGTAGNSDTLALTGASTGVTLATFATLATGTNGTTNASHFAVNNVNSDNAAALATSITDAATGVVTATHTGTNAYLTLTAVTPGTGGNGITLATNATGFSWAAGTLGSGTGGVLGSDGTNSATTFAYWSVNNYASQNQLASNIATATSANTTVAGNMTAVASNNQVTFTPTTVGNFTASAANFSALSGTGSFGGATSAQVQPNTYPAKYGASLTAADCNLDFVVYPTGQVGSGAAATIIAYNQLYGTTGSTGCGTTATVPSTYWAYNTGGSTYAATTSPIISEDGSKIAFIQSDGTTAELVVLLWETTSGGTLTAPITPTITSDITTCTAPCMTVTSLGANDTYSAPFYTYNGNSSGDGGDTVIVGTDTGTLLEISPVFNAGAPVVSTPVTLTSGVAAASPVYDVTSGCVFVGDISGILYSVRRRLYRRDNMRYGYVPTPRSLRGSRTHWRELRNIRWTYCGFHGRQGLCLRYSKLDYDNRVLHFTC